MPAKNSVRSSFGTEGSGPQFSNPWTEIASPLIYLDAQFQDFSSSTIPDRSGNGRNYTIADNGTIAGTYKTDSRGNKYFDCGLSTLKPSTNADYFPNSTAASYPAVTYVMWTRVKPNSTSTGVGDWRTLTRGIGTGNHHVIVQDDGTPGAKIGFWDGSFQKDNYHIASAGAATDGLQTWSGSSAGAGTGNWHFMVVKFQASSPHMRIFINGEQTNPYATATSTTYPSTSPLYSASSGWPGTIGGYPTGQYWGDIAAFAAYGSHLSAAQLTQLYNKTKHFFQRSAGIATARLMDWNAGTAFSQYIVTDYEYPATSFAITSGSFATGLSLNTSTGLVSGTPSGGNASATVQVTFSNGYTASQTIVNNSASLYALTNVTFTPGGATIQAGPSLAQVKSGMSGTPAPSTYYDTYVNMVTNGYILWTVPDTGNYSIDTYGAQGGAGGNTPGYGSRAYGIFSLNKSDVLRMVVGQQGVSGTHTQDGSRGIGSGGGGTFVYNQTTSTLLIAAGGGGGGCANSWNSAAGISAPNSNNGASGAGGQGGGSGGAGGGSSGHAGSGAGYSGNGAGGDRVASSFLNNSIGGFMATSWGSYGEANSGGFGGGGGAGGLAAGGGGGYSGGGSGTWSSQQAGGGGGLYNAGSSQTNTAAARSGNGQITITKL